MNKDFFNKSISLKDIKFSKIDLKKLKNKKEIIIGILILVYIICIILVGNHLLKMREEAKSEYEIKEIKYNSLQNSLSEEKLREQILEMENEKEKLSNKVITVENNIELDKIFSDFKVNAPIIWDNQTVRPREMKDFKDYDIYTVDIDAFSGTLDQVEAFLEYVDNYDKIVRIDTLSFSKNKITGKLGGKAKLTFYFRKEST